MPPFLTGIFTGIGNIGKAVIPVFAPAAIQIGTAWAVTQFGRGVAPTSRPGDPAQSGGSNQQLPGVLSEPVAAYQQQRRDDNTALYLGAGLAGLALVLLLSSRRR